MIAPPSIVAPGVGFPGLVAFSQAASHPAEPAADPAPPEAPLNRKRGRPFGGGKWNAAPRAGSARPADCPIPVWSHFSAAEKKAYLREQQVLAQVQTDSLVRAAVFTARPPTIPLHPPTGLMQHPNKGTMHPILIDIKSAAS